MPPHTALKDTLFVIFVTLAVCSMVSGAVIIVKRSRNHRPSSYYDDIWREKRQSHPLSTQARIPEVAFADSGIPSLIEDGGPPPDFRLAGGDQLPPSGDFRSNSGGQLPPSGDFRPNSGVQSPPGAADGVAIGELVDYLTPPRVDSPSSEGFLFNDPPSAQGPPPPEQGPPPPAQGPPRPAQGPPPPRAEGPPPRAQGPPPAAGPLASPATPSVLSPPKPLNTGGRWELGYDANDLLVPPAEVESSSYDSLKLFSLVPDPGAVASPPLPEQGLTEDVVAAFESGSQDGPPQIFDTSPSASDFSYLEYSEQRNRGREAGAGGSRRRPSGSGRGREIGRQPQPQQPVYSYVKTDKQGHFKWGVRHGQ